jgi:Cu(I)/Ag(I) efflux system membrane protein CusA/SilA
MKVAQVIRDSNRDVGGRAVEMAETEYMVRGKGYLRGKADIEMLVVKSDKGTPVLVRDIGPCGTGARRAPGRDRTQWRGRSGGRHCHGALWPECAGSDSNIKSKIAELQSAQACPRGVTVQTGVRPLGTDLPRHRQPETHAAGRVSLIVALVCIVFLLHVRSALVAILMLPVGMLMAFIAMRLLGMNSNLMSLGGIAIAIGAMIDAAIVMIENAHKHLERLPPEHSTSWSTVPRP